MKVISGNYDISVDDVNDKYDVSIMSFNPASPRSGPMAESKLYLREWLKFRGMKQVDLARAASCTEQQVSDFVNDRQQYSKKWVDLFATGLNCEPYELLLPPPTGDSDTRIDWDLLLEIIFLEKVRELRADIRNKDEPDEAIQEAARRLSGVVKSSYLICEELNISANNQPGIHAALLNTRPLRTVPQ